MTWSFPALPNFFSSEDVTAGRCPKNFFVMNDSGREKGTSRGRSKRGRGVGQSTCGHRRASVHDGVWGPLGGLWGVSGDLGAVARFCQPFSCRSLPIFIFPQEPFADFRLLLEEEDDFRFAVCFANAFSTEERRGISLRTTEPGRISF